MLSVQPFNVKWLVVHFSIRGVILSQLTSYGPSGVKLQRTVLCWRRRETRSSNEEHVTATTVAASCTFLPRSRTSSFRERIVGPTMIEMLMPSMSAPLNSRANLLACTMGAASALASTMFFAIPALMFRRSLQPRSACERLPQAPGQDCIQSSTHRNEVVVDGQTSQKQ